MQYHGEHESRFEPNSCISLPALVLYVPWETRPKASSLSTKTDQKDILDSSHTPINFHPLMYLDLMNVKLASMSLTRYWLWPQSACLTKIMPFWHKHLAMWRVTFYLGCGHLKPVYRPSRWYASRGSTPCRLHTMALQELLPQSRLKTRVMWRQLTSTVHASFILFNVWRAHQCIADNS